MINISTKNGWSTDSSLLLQAVREDGGLGWNPNDKHLNEKWMVNRPSIFLLRYQDSNLDRQNQNL